MHIQRTQPSATRTLLEIAISSQELLPIKKSVLAKQAARVSVPGFRPGRAPLDLVEKQLDPTMLQTEVVQEAVNFFYDQAVHQENIRPLSDPDISLRKFVPYSQLEFEVGIDVFGEIHLPEIKKLKVEKQVSTVRPKDVEDVLQSLRRQQASRKPAKRAAQLGDEVTIDFKGEDKEGQPIPGAEGKDYPLVLGSGSFIPGFEEAILDMKTDEKKNFEVVFPKDYRVAHLRGQTVHFSLRVKKTETLEMPELSDSFASKVGPFKTLVDLKKDIKKQLQQERETEARQGYEQTLLETTAKETTAAIPEKLIDEQTERLEKEERNRLIHQGITWQEHLKAEGITEAEHRQRQRRQATESIKVSLVLSELVSQHDIEVTEDEITTRLQLLRGQYTDPAMLRELDKPENKQEIGWRIRNEKALAVLVKLHKT